MAFCIKAESAVAARYALREMSGKLELGAVPSQLLIDAVLLPNDSAYIGHDDESWRAEDEPWDTPVLTVAQFVERYQGDTTEEETPTGRTLTTELATVRTDDDYLVYSAKGLVNAEGVVLAVLEGKVDALGNPTVTLEAEGEYTALIVNGERLALRKGTPEVARDYLTQHSKIFKGLL